MERGKMNAHEANPSWIVETVPGRITVCESFTYVHFYFSVCVVPTLEPV
jgi:hypothetical protein